MGQNRQIIVHLFLTISISFQTGMMSSDTRLEEFVWFEDIFRNPKQHLYEIAFEDTSSTLELKKNQTVKKENRSKGKMDDESFAEYFFANKWK